MKNIRIQQLNHENFRIYGDYANLINPEAVSIGNPPVEFFRDVIPLHLAQNNVASFSICRVEKRTNLISSAEYHSYCQEGIMPLDGDVLIHVAHATPDEIPVDAFQVFRIPKGTMVTLKAGVWHHAPFAIDCDYVNVLIILPERTYSNDCIVKNISSEEQLLIV